MSSSKCCFLTCIQISQEAGQMVWYSHLFKNFPEFVVVHTGKGLITSWKIDEETMETVTEFIFLSSKITADGDCSHEIKRCSLLGRKVVTKLGSVLKERDITLPTNVHKVKAMVFPGVRYRWRSCTIKKAECWRMDPFKLWCWRMEKTLESPLDCKEIQPVNPKGNQPWIFSGKTDAEAPILWPPEGKSQLIGKTKQNKTLDPGKYWRQQQKAWQRMRWLGGVSNPTEWVWASFRGWWWTWKRGIQKFMGSQGVRHDWATEQQKPGRVFMYSWLNLNGAFLNFWRWVEHNFLARSHAAACLEYFVLVVNLFCVFSGWHLGVSVPHNDGCCLSQSQLNWTLDHDLCFRRQPWQVLWLFEWLMILGLVLGLFLHVQTL